MKTLLQELKEQALALPAKQELSESVKHLRHYTERADRAADHLRQCLASIEHSSSILPADDFAKAQGRIRSGAKVSTQLVENLEADPRFVNSKDCDDKFRSLLEHFKGAADDAEDAWRRFLTSRVSSYERLVAAIKKLKLGSSSKLSAILDRLRSASTKPPGNARTANAVRDDLEAWRKETHSTGLTGKPQELLEKAAAGGVGSGGADARLLADTEVRAFLDKYKLWDLFKVIIP